LNGATAMYSLSKKQQHGENTNNASNYEANPSGAKASKISDMLSDGLGLRATTSMGSRLISSAKRVIAPPSVSPKPSTVRKQGFKPPVDFTNSLPPPSEQVFTKSLRTTKPEESDLVPIRSAKPVALSTRVGATSTYHTGSDDNASQLSSSNKPLRTRDPTIQPRPKQIGDSSHHRKGEKRKVVRKKIVKKNVSAPPGEIPSRPGVPLPGTKQQVYKQTPTAGEEVANDRDDRRSFRKSISTRSALRSYDEQSSVTQQANYQDGNQPIHMQGELNEMAAKHAEEMYWMKLELNTVRKSKEAVEDRIAELYRDVQDVLQQANTENNGSQYIGDDSILNTEDLASSNGMILVKSDTISAMQNQIDKYERMLRIMKHQTDLIKNSSESVVTSLKEEISNLMEEKTRIEMNLMNKLAEVHREKRDLSDQLVHFQQKARKDQENNDTTSSEELEQVTFNLKLVKAENKRLREQLQTVATRITSSRDDDSHSNTMNDDNDIEVKEQLRQQIELLQSTNTQLTESIQNARQTALVNLKKWNKDKIALQDQVQQLATEVTSLRSLEGSADLIHMLQEEKDNYSETLDRVSLLTRHANDAAKNLELVLSDLKGSQDVSSDSTSRKSIVERDRYRSFLEKALLVQGDMKMSLMLIELKCRNGLLAIKNVQHGNNDNNIEGLRRSDSFSNKEQRQKILNNTLDSIRILEDKVNGDIEALQAQSQLETERANKLMEEKVAALKTMMTKQASLEEEIIQLKQNSTGLSSAENPDAANASSIELFVSRKALETLQTEVLSVVQRVNEQNETIARLRSEIEEHRIRERTLMSELKRNINDQFSRQIHDYSGTGGDLEGNLDEHGNAAPASQRLPLFYASGNEEYPESENEFSEDEGDDASYEEVEYEEDDDGSCGSSQYEEYTVYDEQTVVEDPSLVTKEKFRRQKNDAIVEETVLDVTDNAIEEEIVIEESLRRKSL
jgi:hypothetical protein